MFTKDKAIKRESTLVVAGDGNRVGGINNKCHMKDNIGMTKYSKTEL